MNINKIASKVARRFAGKQEEYQQYFKDKLDKFDVESPAELDEDEKSEFFNEVDDGWEAEHEKTARKRSAYTLDKETFYKMNDAAGSKDILLVIGSVRSISKSLKQAGFDTNQIHDFLIKLVTVRA